MRIKISLSAILIALLLFLSFSSSKPIVLDAEDIKDDREFKAVWMSTFVGEAPYSSESQFKSHMNNALNMFEYYGLNAVIFHVRTHNNAFYPSNLNPRASWWSNVNFEVFDPIGWLIKETHKRGIEFHAWMNPYRVSTGRSYQVGELPEENPQNNPDNVIVEGDTTILNPAKPEVRQHIFDTILEFAELYPTVDAIHFDDYFYISTGAQPNDPVQRREQVNILIEGISEILSEFNETNNTAIQLGISPTGIYRNGNGIVDYDDNGMPITNGSDTNGFQHYGNYLYADTLKWAINGWIDYLLPQTYWATNHNSASYVKLMDWWDKVFKNLDVNLYSGIGVYMANNSGTYNWANNMQEMDGQLSLLDTKENVDGYSIYSYKHLANGYNNTNNKSGQQIRNAYETESRRAIKIIPEIKTIPKLEVPYVSNIENNNGVLSWDKVKGGKFYYIYYNETKVTYSSDEIIGVIGQESETMTFDVSSYGQGDFSVRAISRTNHLSPILHEEQVAVTFRHNDSTNSEIITKGTTVEKPTEPVKDGYLFLGWYVEGQLFDFNNSINENITLTAKWKKKIYYVNLTLHHGYDSISKTLQIEEGTIPAKPEEPKRDGYTFVGWFFNNQEFLFNEPLNRNITLVAVWELKQVNVLFDYNYDDINVNKQIPYGTSIEQIKTPTRVGYKFLGWYLNDDLFSFNTPIYDDVVLIAKWEEIVYVNVTYIIENETNIVSIIKDSLLDNIEEPLKEGYTFIGWYKDNNLFDFNIPITEDITLQAIFGIEVVFDYGSFTELVIIEENNKALEPFSPHKDGYIFKGWYKDDVLFSFETIITEPITLNALYKTIDNLENIGVYKDTNIRLVNNNEALVYHALIEESKSKLEHGFYLVYGRVSYEKILAKLNTIDNDIYINDKLVLKVKVDGVKEDGTYSVVLTGIPKDSFDDIITVIPYFVSENGVITIAQTFKISSINQAKKQTNINVNANLYCLKEDIKRKDYLFI